MVLTTIFVVRHGFRPAFHVNPYTGEISGSRLSPTGRPADPALTAYGVQQSQDLAKLAETLEPQVSRIYTSPYYRCVQTIQPFAARLPQVPVICDQGLGDWYGQAPFSQPTPASLNELAAFFPFLTERTSLIPAPHGESISDLHDRMAYVLSRIIAELDATLLAKVPQSIVISSHAAPIIAIGRVLTGRMPQDPTEPDFDTYTCSISKFQRKSREDWIQSQREKGGELYSKVEWKEGRRGVGGGWECQLNASVSHLPNGGERNWHFSGDESFVSAIESHNEPVRDFREKDARPDGKPHL